MLGALAGLVFLWFLYTKREDPIGEMVVDMDDIDSDDDGEDVDET